LLDKKEALLARIKYDDWRELKPNESYYTDYDNIKGTEIKVDYGHPSTPYEYS
jgi:hypothetical protein